MSRGASLLVHYHIPRTGGTTLVSMLRAQYGSASTVVLARTQPLSAVRRLLVSGDDLKKIKALSTSHPVGVSRLVKATKVITILRSPEDRVCSYFDFVRRTTGEINGRWQELHLMANRMTLQQYLESGEDPEVNDWQVRMLSGRGVLPPFGGVTDAHLESARSNMAAFDGVGLTDRYEESVRLFARLLGWQIVGVDTVVLNASPAAELGARSQLPAPTLALVRELNRKDEALYQSARELLYASLGYQAGGA